VRRKCQRPPQQLWPYGRPYHDEGKFLKSRQAHKQIPVPLANSEIAAVSRRARDRWLQQDSSAVTANGARSRSQSPTNETIYAGGGGTIRSGGSRPASRPPQRNAPRDALDHGCRCNNCNEWIMGRRYQCANCPSEPESFNLVSHPNPDPFQAHVTVLHMRDPVI
jgi:hypothetical protein